ncbi:MAG TPA: Gfo/Idh/MocA family oxidoreductase [Pirellulales bacterium]|nr:Gfo/Idh/MocA family oxidoreductase [Pirellulales bacterium]
MNESRPAMPRCDAAGRPSRRTFLRQSAALGSLAGLSVGTGFWSSRLPAEERSASEKLNIGVVGTANQARYSIDNLKGENIVALCDVDEVLLGKAGAEFPKAKTYVDFRRLLEQPDLDAVAICTPDHIHAPATVRALRLGKHVYCEKPLTHTVAECRLVREEAAKAKKATQMGTQIHAGDNYRRVVEIVQSGAIGPVTEVHTWAGHGFGGLERPSDTPPVPAGLHWDLWLGPAPERPYNPAYVPFKWRSWWDFGGGVVADLACHHMDLPFWALGLRAPTSVAAQGPPVHSESCPLGLEVRYEFPARDGQPPVKLTWYNGERIPRQIHGFELGEKKQLGPAGNLFVGQKGLLFADYGTYRLLPEADFAGFTPPPASIPNSIGHHAEWIKACKEGTPTTCNFDYSGGLTEAVLLANVSYRSGQPLVWDAAGLKVTNTAEAERFLHKKYRAGWEI